MIREINLAKEADQMIDLLSRVFRYPDHPEWDASEDSIREVQGRARAYRRMAPLLRLFPSYKNRIQGLAYDIKGETVGLSIFYETSPHIWHIDYIGVLSEHRRKGVGNALVAATLERIKKLSGQHVSLEVNEGNAPANRLYEQAGFECLTQRSVFELQRGQTVAPVSMGEQYQINITAKKDWEIQYKLATAVVPQSVAADRPITPDLYKPGRFALLGKMLNRLAGRKFKFISLMDKGEIVGWALLNMSRNGQSVNGIDAMTISDDAVASHLLEHSLKMISDDNSAPTRIVIDSWQTALVKSAESLLTLKMKTNRLGQTL